MEKSQDPKTKERRMRRILLSRWFIGGVVAVLFYTLIGFFLLPYLSKHYLVRFATENLKRRLTIEEVRFNPYGFRMEILGFAFEEGDGTPILGFEKLVGNFELSSLFHWAWTFAEVSLDAPRVNIQMGRDGILNMGRLVEDLAGKEETPGGENPNGGLPRLLFQQVALNLGRIDIIDFRGAEPADLTVSPVNVRLRNINTLPERKGPYAIEAKTPDGETFRWEGEISLNPLRSQGSLAVTGFKVATVWEFIRDRLLSEAPSGRLDIETDYWVDFSSESPSLKLEGLGFKVSDLKIALRGESASLLELKTLTGEDGRFDLSTREFTLRELRVSSGRVFAAVDSTGVPNWTKLTAPPAGKIASEGPEGPKDAATPWKVLLNSVEVTEVAVVYADQSRKRATEAEIGSVSLGFSGKIESGEGLFQATAEGIRTRLRDLEFKLAGDSEPMLQITDMDLEGGSLDLKNRNMTVRQIDITGGNARATLGPEGEINWALVMNAGDRGTSERGAREKGAKTGDKGAPWSLLLKSIGLQDFGVVLEDQRPSAGASLTLERMDLKVSDVTGDGRTPLQFDLKVGVKEGGEIAVKGRTIPAEKSAEAALSVKHLSLNPLQPYLSPLARLNLDSGSLDVEGNVSYGLPKAEAKLVFKGEAAVSEFLLREQDTKQPFAAWDALTLSKIHFSLNPNRLTVNEIKAKNPSGKLIINEDRTVNLTQILVKKQGDRSAEKVRKKADDGKDLFPVTVNRVRVDGGSLEFADLSLRPQFATLIHQLKGLVSGISSSRESRASVDLDGRVDEFGLARIRGNINPFDPKTYTDISMDFRNVEMTNLTPYSSRFAGYRIASGKLSLDLKYEIQKSRLLGENQILVDQLTLGEQIESPDAVKLPLKLAIALLKDPEGKIDIGLPVKGSLDDPEFSFGHLIWKAIVNLLTKIVTSPFRALASILGVEAENLDTIVFDPGVAALLPPEKEKLRNLSKALQKRPKLRLEVKGTFDPEVDGRALRSASLRRSLAEREGRPLSPEEDPGPVVFQDPNTRAAIETLFTERHTPQILTDLRQAFEKGLAAPAQKAEKVAKTPKAQAPLPAEAYDSFYRDLYSRLLEITPLEPETLDRLARRRSEAVRQELLSGGETDVARVVVLDPEATKESNEKSVAVKLSLSVSG
ncbi:MAG: DUF748 domain-containing protein [Deltaproteobacteria bacterium]|nr:DUF748 domain-containing protein [Deltaproteobacteria bacterium]